MKDRLVECTQEAGDLLYVAVVLKVLLYVQLVVWVSGPSDNVPGTPQHDVHANHNGRYVPSNWMHAVVNLENSIGVAVEVGHNRRLLHSQLGRYYATLRHP